MGPRGDEVIWNQAERERKTCRLFQKKSDLDLRVAIETLALVLLKIEAVHSPAVVKE